MNLKKYLLKISSFVSLPLVSLASISCSNNQNVPPVDYEMINKETGLAFNSKGEITKYYYYEGNDFTNITIPEYLVNNSIPSSQYYGYKQRITSIGNNVFSAKTKYENGLDIPLYNKYAKDLNKVTLPNSLQIISNGAFYGTSITEIIIPNSVTTIQLNAFQYCANLINVKLSNNIKYIDSSAFEGTHITNIIFPETLLEIGFRAFDSTKLSGSLYIPDSVISIDNYAFDGTQITEVSLPSGCEVQSHSFPPGCTITRRP